MSPKLTRKLKSLLLCCIFGGIAGILFQFINENHIDQRSMIVGLPLGLVFGIMEFFLFPRAARRLRRWPFTYLLVFKTLLYSSAIIIVSLVLMFLDGLFEGRKFKELVEVALTVEQLTLVVYTLVTYGLLLFLFQVNRLLGAGVIWKFLLGKYHHPREEERIFMFLDMKSSTTIAEHLGHAKFYELLNELFHEISQPVLETKAEIYQYVGDEVILTWNLDDGIKNSNCLKSFFLFQSNLLKHGRNYQQKFGIKPQFKAGLHFGKVITAQIGDLKREIVYNGDVLNTTARIQQECNKYNRNCLISGALMDRLKDNNGFHWEKMDTVTLRGKEKEVELFSVSIHI